MPSACGPPAAVKACVLLLALVLAVYILGPLLYWRFVEGADSTTCPPCACDCPLETSSVLLPAGFGNNSADCTGVDSSMQEELDKNSVDLLTEELKIEGTVADESQQRADAALLEAKKLSSQYQKEAEKCNSGMETCEEAREKAEAALTAQKLVSTMWEQRARDLGWKSG